MPAEAGEPVGGGGGSGTGNGHESGRPMVGWASALPSGPSGEGGHSQAIVCSFAGSGLKESLKNYLTKSSCTNIFISFHAMPCLKGIRWACL